ncbi:hypothetical protein Q9189_005428 [Teloschistes chrysophthalmus]
MSSEPGSLPHPHLERSPPGQVERAQILAVLVQACHLENVEDIMHVKLGQTVRKDGSKERIRMDRTEYRAAVSFSMTASARQQWQKTHVMNSATNIIVVSSKGIADNGAHGPQVRKTAPQAVKGRDMRTMELPSSTGPEALSRIISSPDIQISYLRAITGRYTANISLVDMKCFSRSDGNLERLDGISGISRPNCAIEVLVYY